MVSNNSINLEYMAGTPSVYETSQWSFLQNWHSFVLSRLSATGDSNNHLVILGESESFPSQHASGLFEM